MRLPWPDARSWCRGHPGAITITGVSTTGPGTSSPTADRNVQAGPTGFAHPDDPRGAAPGAITASAASACRPRRTAPTASSRSSRPLPTPTAASRHRTWTCPSRPRLLDRVVTRMYSRRADRQRGGPGTVLHRRAVARPRSSPRRAGRRAQVRHQAPGRARDSFLRRLKSSCRSGQA